MGFFNFRRGKVEQIDGDTLLKRELSTKRAKETRELNQQLKEMEHKIAMAELQIEHQQLQEQLNDMLGEEPEDHIQQPANMEDMLLMTFMNKFQASQPAPVQPISNNPTALGEVGLNLSDEGIKSYLSQVPKPYLKMAKGMTDEDLKQIIIQKSPEKLNEDTINRAVVMVKNGI